MQVRAAVLAVALILVGCSTFQGGAAPEGNIVTPSNFRSGSGMVSSVAVLPNANKSAAAGGEKADRNLYRVALQMDNGGYQTVDVDSGMFMAGQAVELTNDGRIVLISGTTVNQARGR